MRKQIAAANWKMNLSMQEADQLMTQLLSHSFELTDNQVVLLAVPFPYLPMVQQKIDAAHQWYLCAQNCAATDNGAFTGETSAQMLHSMGVRYAIIGHSERRTYYHETNSVLADKVNWALKYGVQPIFCCGEPIEVRESSNQNIFVQKQLEDSLFHLTDVQMRHFIIAYEPMWAIGTGKTASSEQAQDMHQHIRSVIAAKYGKEIADTVSILYGGSVKASNAVEIFSKPDVDGGLVGGASLSADEFAVIINSLKK